jgi:Cu2+-exporting ATPase
MFLNKLFYVVKVEGMMCAHCAAHVEEALSKIPGVKGVKVDLDKKTASVKAKSEISEGAFRAAIEEAGYKFVGVE